jgi:hypothetical protein
MYNCTTWRQSGPSLSTKHLHLKRGLEKEKEKKEDCDPITMSGPSDKDHGEKI